MAYPGYSVPGTTTTTTQTTFVTVPQTWNRIQYTYPSYYNRRVDFVVPIGVDPTTAQLFMQASAVFRMFDTNWSGALDKKEWKRAMNYLGYYMSKYDRKRLFAMVDTDRSGRINEREFCEYWVYSRLYGGTPIATPYAPGAYPGYGAAAPGLVPPTPGAYPPPMAPAPGYIAPTAPGYGVPAPAPYY